MVDSLRGSAAVVVDDVLGLAFILRRSTSSALGSRSLGNPYPSKLRLIMLFLFLYLSPSDGGFLALPACLLRCVSTRRVVLRPLD